MAVRGSSLADFRQWPTVATYSLLPNVSGATIQNANLAVGDLCQVTGEGVYACVTATAGSAVWLLLNANTNVLDTITGSQGLWLFNNALTDSSGNARTLTAAGTTRFAIDSVGKQYQALALGTGGYTQNAAGLNMTSNMYFEMLITASLGNTLQFLFTNDVLNFRRFYLLYSAGSQIAWGFDDTGGTLREVLASFGMPIGQRVFLQGTRTITAGDTTLTLYANGQQIGTGTFVGQTPRTTGADLVTYVAQDNAAANRFGVAAAPGAVSTLQFSTTAPTLATIQQRARKLGFYVP